MSLVKNRLLIYGSIKDIIKFINDNYESDIYHPSDGKYPPNNILFFGKMYPTPNDILDDKNKIYRWRMNNWGTAFLSDSENQINKITVMYKHDYDYTPYTITSEDGMFNSYVLRKLSEYSEMFYGENIHDNENEFISIFNTNITPPSKMITNWINVYQFSTLIFRLDYWDEEDRFVGNIHYDYSDKLYVLEHYVKDNNLIKYIKYMIEEDIKPIEIYAEEIANLVLSINIKDDYKTFDKIESIVLEELEQLNSLDDQVKYIANMITYLNNKKCNS